VSVWWDDNSNNEDGFIVERKFGPSGAWGDPIALPPNADALGGLDNITPLPAPLEYCFRVKAINEISHSTWSNTACTKPALAARFQQTGATETTVSVAFTDNSLNEDRFILYRHSGTTRTEVASWPAQLNTATVMRKTISGLEPGSQYSFSVDAVNDVGFSRSSTLVAETDEPEPQPATVSVSLQRQPVIAGNIPYRSQFPPLGVGSGRLTQVRFPQTGSADRTLYFVRQGRSTAECNNPSAVVPITEGQTTTPDQLEAIFGQEQPTYEVSILVNRPLVFTACINPGTAPDFVSIQITVIRN
jgi:Fibronectin type III domain